MDSIWNCAFAVDKNMQYDEKNEYYEKCESLFKETVHLTPLHYLGTYFYEFKESITSFLLKSVDLATKFTDKSQWHAFSQLVYNFKRLVEEREKEANINIKRKDYLQLVLDEAQNDNNFNFSVIKKSLKNCEVE